MRYHIDTIPVWDAWKEQTECPLCVLRRRMEMKDVELFLGGSVMEPDTRIRVNEKGFCARHHVLLYAQQNRLGHALMTHTHLQETAARAEKILARAKAAEGAQGTSLMARFRGRAAEKNPLAEAADALDALTGQCILCDTIQESMNRYLYTTLHLFTHDAAFRKAFEESRGVCLKDAACLLRMAAEKLGSRERAEFAAALEKGMRENLRRVEEELEWFTLKFDYRNADKPWNNSRDALERAVTKLRGWCIGAEPREKK